MLKAQAMELRIKSGQAICFDFDGVIHKYRDGWRDGSIYDEPNMEMIDLIRIFQGMNIPVFICSTRNPEQIIDWFEKSEINIRVQLVKPGDMFWNDNEIVGVTNRKLPAQLYIDDRAFRYDGQTVKEIFTQLSDKVSKEVEVKDIDEHM